MISVPFGNPPKGISLAECYRFRGSDTNTYGDNGHDVVVQITSDKLGCKYDGDECKDDFCLKYIEFEHYDVEKCVENFSKLKDCGEKRDSAWNNRGGIYFSDCMRWTILTQDNGKLPPDTDDDIIGLGNPEEALAAMGHVSPE